MSTASATPTIGTNHNCANLIEVDLDNNEIQQHQQQPGKGTTASTKVQRSNSKTAATQRATQNIYIKRTNSKVHIHKITDSRTYH